MRGSARMIRNEEVSCAVNATALALRSDKVVNRAKRNPADRSETIAMESELLRRWLLNANLRSIGEKR